MNAEILQKLSKATFQYENFIWMLVSCMYTSVGRSELQ